MSKESMQEQLNDYMKDAAHSYDLIDAVGYIRYSSPMQDGGISVEYQMREIEEYAAKNRMRITKWYIDRAASAKTVAGRDEFMKMVRDVEAKLSPRNIIVFATARVFRDAIDSSLYREKFRKNGAKLHSVTQTIDDDTTNGRLVTDLMARIDQFKIEEIGEYVSAATKLLITEGFFAGGFVPIGYKKEKVLFNGNERVKLVIDENDAVKVRYIFDSFTNGRPIQSICKSMYENGMLKPNDKAFEANDLRRILRSIIYIGSRTYKMKNGEEVYCPNYCDPIVSKEQFRKAQEIFEKQAKVSQGRIRKRVYPLSGKLVCGLCGAACCSHTRKSYLYYKCNQHKKTVSRCSAKLVKKEWLESVVFNAIKQNILSDDAINKITKIVMDKLKKASAHTEDRQELMAKKKELDIEIVELVEMKLKKTISEELFQSIKQKKDAELEPIERKLAQLIAAADSTLDEKSIKAKINAIFDSSKSFEECDPLALKDLFGQLVEEVTINNTQVIICLRIPFIQSLFNEKDGSSFAFLNIQIERERRRRRH